MKKSILIVISIFLSTGVFAYEKELFGGELPYGVKTLEEVIHCFEGKWMDENLYNSLKRASETSHYMDIYSSEKRKCPKCGSDKVIPIVYGSPKHTFYCNRVPCSPMRSNAAVLLFSGYTFPAASHSAPTHQVWKVWNLLQFWNFLQFWKFWKRFSKK